MRINITLEDKTKITVDGFEFTYTYDGLLEGSINYDKNIGIYDRLSYPSSWGQRKVLKIKPSEEDLNNKLKPIIYSVWLNSQKWIQMEF